MSEETLSPREKAIRARQAAGLSRQMAEQVQANQEAHDAELAATEKAKAKKGKSAEGEKPENK